MSDHISLDDLFDSQIAASIATKQAAKHAKHGTPPVDLRPDRALFTNPLNWKQARNIVLVHTETQTVLGVFAEWTHRTEANCRKLLRITETVALIAATEYVTGSWWLGGDAKPAPAQTWHERKPAIAHLHLSKLGVHAPAVELVVCLAYGAMERVELAADTTFAQEAGGQEQLVFLVAGTNVLDVMSRESKVSLRVELGL